MLTTRRQALKLMGCLGAAGTLLLPMRAAFSAPPTDARLVIVMLRGGLDGLAAVPPYADPDYVAMRPRLALPTAASEQGIIKLNGQFGLHPAMAPLKAWYDAGDMLIIHAVSTRDHSNSHFEGQRVLESGSDKPGDAQDGWLNRALSQLEPQGGPLGMAVGRAVPLILQGNTGIRAYVPTRLPIMEEDFLQRLDALYANDPLFRDVFAKARPSVNEERGSQWRWDETVRRPTMRVIAKDVGNMLAQPNGPRVAVLESHGWDTHLQQAARLPGLLVRLVEGLTALREGLGSAWQQTVVLVVSEFGRAVRENDAAGTDHGAGGVAFALGGAVSGGHVVGPWPGLIPSALFAGHALMPTTDMRALFKAALHDHLGLTESAIEDLVFPNSRPVTRFTDLIRT